MDLDSLRLYVDLAETGSFSKTADRCYMSQSAVSQRIRTLESEFGQILVERGKGRPGAQFTEAGKLLLEGAREIVARADSLKREIAELGETVGGSLRVATVYSIGLHALTPALQRFLRDFPQVNLHLEYLRTDRIYEALNSGAIDCGIVALPRERPHIEIISLGEENMTLILPPGHPLTGGASVSVTDLDGLPFIAFDPDIPTRALIDGLLKNHNVSVDVMQAYDNIETIKQVVEIGLGVSIVPEPTVRREIRDGLIITRPFTDLVLTRPTGILIRRGRTRSRALRQFLRVLTRPGALAFGVPPCPTGPEPGVAGA
ncbi:MAG: LysR family transcriptional regulator [Capsulimonadales bacterium]|nr:LysR family transcriptional regulator [Capsulimonadales bacterium]